MQQDTVCKTVRQYSSDTLSQEEMEMLREVAEDYCRVKNYVYERYGGKGGLSKIYPGYTVQNEMTRAVCGRAGSAVGIFLLGCL